MASNETLAPGSVFAGRFRVVELLSEGEMGVTYAVEALRGGKRCALKVMDSSIVQDPASRGRFATQAQSASKVASDHLVRTIDAGIDEGSGCPWLTTDLLQGEDLAARIARDGPRPFQEVGFLVDALGEALGKAHEQGLVHYDLTPENVHLGPAAPLSVKLRELAISRFVSDACALEQDLIGTAIWMPPEQFDLGRVLTPAANVWSLGLLAFYAATGRPYWTNAFDGDAPTKALLGEILREPLVAASQRAAALGCKIALPGKFDAWFARCLVRDPGRRFADAREARVRFAKIGWLDVDPEELKATTKWRRDRAVSPAAITPTPPTAAVQSVAPAPSPASKKRGRSLTLWLLATGAALGGGLWGARWMGRPQAPAAPVPAVQAALRSAPPSPQPPPTSTVAITPPAPQAPVSAADSSAPSSAMGATAGSYAFAAGTAETDPGGYDLAAALRAINRVYYGDCRVGSPGKIVITFAPSGRVKKVDIADGSYDEPTARCIAARFSTATVPAFRGVAQSVTAKVVPTP